MNRSCGSDLQRKMLKLPACKKLSCPKTGLGNSPWCFLSEMNRKASQQDRIADFGAQAASLKMNNVEVGED